MQWHLIPVSSLALISVALAFCFLSSLVIFFFGHSEKNAFTKSSLYWLKWLWLFTLAK